MPLQHNVFPVPSEVPAHLSGDCVRPIRGCKGGGMPFEDLTPWPLAAASVENLFSGLQGTFLGIIPHSFVACRHSGAGGSVQWGLRES